MVVGKGFGIVGFPDVAHAFSRNKKPHMIVRCLFLSSLFKWTGQRNSALRNLVRRMKWSRVALLLRVGSDTGGSVSSVLLASFFLFLSLFLMVSFIFTGC